MNLLKSRMHRKAVIREVIKRYRCIFLSMCRVFLFFPNYSCHKVRTAGVGEKVRFLEVINDAVRSQISGNHLGPIFFCVRLAKLFCDWTDKGTLSV